MFLEEREASEPHPLGVVEVCCPRRQCCDFTTARENDLHSPLNQVKGASPGSRSYSPRAHLYSIVTFLALNESGIVEPAPETIDNLRESVRRGRVKKTHSR
jgi:hypothetical protein